MEDVLIVGLHINKFQLYHLLKFDKISGNFLFDSFGSCLYGFDNVPRVLIKLQFEGFYQAFVNNLLRTIFSFKYFYLQAPFDLKACAIGK